MIKNYDGFLDYLINNNRSEELSIPQILKTERTKLEYTLQELASGICSVSSLSKLENGLMHAKEDFIKRLFEKMGVDYQNLECCDSKVSEECILNYFYKKYDFIENNYENFHKGPSNGSSLIAKCFYNLIKKDQYALANNIKAIDKIKFTLTQFNGVTFVYLVSAYYMLISDYEKAIYYLSDLEKVKFNNKYLRGLYLEASIECFHYTNSILKLVNCYNKYKEEFFIGHNYGMILEMRMIYDLAIYNDFKNDVLTDIETINYENIPSISYFNVMYYHYLLRIKTENYSDLFLEIYEKGYYVDIRYHALLSFLAFKIDGDEYYETLSKLTYDHHDYNAIHETFIHFVNLYALKDMEEVMTFLRSEVISNSYLRNISLYFDVYQDVYLSYLGSDCKYKEFYTYVTKNILKK